MKEFLEKEEVHKRLIEESQRKGLSVLAKEIGVGPSLLHRWIKNGLPPSRMSAESKEKLCRWGSFDILELELKPCQVKPTLGTLRSTLINDRVQRRHRNAKRLASNPLAVPVLDTSEVARYQPALCAWKDWLIGHADNIANIAGSKPGWFALKLEKQTILATHLGAMRLLVAASEFPHNGDIVVVRIAEEEQVVVKRYEQVDGGVIKLMSITQGNDQEYQWDVKEKPGYVLWIWPVVKIEIALRSDDLF